MNPTSRLIPILAGLALIATGALVIVNFFQGGDTAGRVTRIEQASPCIVSPGSDACRKSITNGVRTCAQFASCRRAARALLANERPKGGGHLQSGSTPGQQPGGAESGPPRCRNTVGGLAQNTPDLTSTSPAEHRIHSDQYLARLAAAQTETQSVLSVWTSRAADQGVSANQVSRSPDHIDINHFEFDDEARSTFPRTQGVDVKTTLALKQTSEPRQFVSCHSPTVPGDSDTPGGSSPPPDNKPPGGPPNPPPPGPSPPPEPPPKPSPPPPEPTPGPVDRITHTVCHLNPLGVRVCIEVPVG